MRFVLSLLLALGLAVPLQAEAPQRFVVEGERLIFDAEVTAEDQDTDISYDDLRELRRLLRAHDEVRVLEINSEGGGYYAAIEISALITDFGLDTHVRDRCESSCVTVFLGGAKRTMARGARIGFHQLSWSASAIEDYYTRNAERRGWDTPFDFGEWMYTDTQTETYNRLSFMVSRGVDAEFAIQTIRKPDASMWYPYRAVLRVAGVLTE